MEFVIVTGLSGSGKSRAVDALEDIGFFCVDNMPPSFIEKIYELCAEEEMEKVAVVTDARGGYLFHDIAKTLDSLDEQKSTIKYCFSNARMRCFISDTRKPEENTRSSMTAKAR